MQKGKLLNSKSYNMTVSAIYPTGKQTSFHHDFNSSPAPLYIVEAYAGDILLASQPATEADIREAFSLSYDGFRACLNGGSYVSRIED